jgi:hypothetical protein
MKMDFQYLARETVRFDSLLGDTTLVVSGIITLIIIIPILLLFIIKRKKKATKLNILIYHNKLKELQKNSNNWQKGKNRIEKLLYEMTEKVQPVECPNPVTEVPNNKNNMRDYDIPVYGRHHKILIERNAKLKRRNDLNTPLDIQELRDVATLAKRLRSRTRHSVGT